jgi:hypothetical protein
VTTQLVRTPAERANGTAAMLVAFGRPVGVAAAGRAATKANIASTAERIRLLLADHVRAAATRLGAPLPAADSGGPDR